MKRCSFVPRLCEYCFSTALCESCTSIATSLPRRHHVNDEVLKKDAVTTACNHSALYQSTFICIKYSDEALEADSNSYDSRARHNLAQVRLTPGSCS
jgi:hypothetical protein